MFKQIIFAAVSAAFIFSANPCLAASIGGAPVAFATHAAGLTTITNKGETGNIPASFAFCVGPNLDNCKTSGLYGAVSITDRQLTVSFFGDVFIADGSFTLTFTGFNGLLRSVTPDSSSGSLLAGSFGLTSFNNSQISLSGYADSEGFISYNGLNKPVYSFDLATEAAPEPASLLLFGLGAAGVTLFGLYRRLADNEHHARAQA